MRELAMYMSACFLGAGMIGLSLLVLEFALCTLRDHYAKMDPIPVVPTRPASRQRHYGWGIEPGANPYAEYAVRTTPRPAVRVAGPDLGATRGTVPHGPVSGL